VYEATNFKDLRLNFRKLNTQMAKHGMPIANKF